MGVLHRRVPIADRLPPLANLRPATGDRWLVTRCSLAKTNENVRMQDMMRCLFFAAQQCSFLLDFNCSVKNGALLLDDYRRAVLE